MVKKKPGQKSPAAHGKANEIEIEFDSSASPADLEPTSEKSTFNVDEDGNDLGGLMALMSKATQRGKGPAAKKGKKKKGADDDEEEDAAAILARLDEQDSEVAAARASSPGAEKDTRNGTNGIEGVKTRETGSVISNGSSKSASQPKSTGTGPVGSPAATKQPVIEDDEDSDAGDGAPGDVRIKSKKEKERERKERQKQAKKASQQQQKGGLPKQENEEEGASLPVTTAARPKTAPATTSAAAPAPDKDVKGTGDDDGEDDAEVEGTATGGKDKKKKKKKPAVAEAPAPAATTKRKGPNVAALKELLELQKKAEEEARRKQEEEERRIREEEERLMEEERKKEEAKQRKKEKEKAKKEQLKREGQYMTAKQKQQLEMDRLRTQQLLQAQGIVIPALAQKEAEASGDGASLDGQQKKRGAASLYGKKKRPGTAPAQAEHSRAESPTTSNNAEKVIEPESAQIREEEGPKRVPLQESAAPVKDSWDDEEEEEKVKDSWDMSSDEEEVKAAVQSESKKSAPPIKDSKKAPAPSTAPSRNQVAAAPKASPAQNVANGAKAPPLQQAPKVIEVESDESEDESDEEVETISKDKSKTEAPTELRSPICVVLGHVDAGKTKLLDKIRQTNVQEGEAGGITQQIGATYFPIDAVQQKADKLAVDSGFEFKVPGLLIIDTPGHESFSNLRSRGSSLCNIAILVVDILSGLEAQTRESIGLLRQRKTPFVVALNKVDRLYGWKSTPGNAIRDSFANQPRSVMQEFDDRLRRVMGQLAEEGLNSKLYYDNESFARNVSIVPTSAMTGEGIPDLLYLVLKLTQERMSKNLMYLSALEATVLEVKVVEGLGTTIDVILSNGVLREGDRIVLCGLGGAIVTTIRALLTPQPLREIRVKSPYMHLKEVKAAMGVKIAANNLDGAIAGSRLLVVGPDNDEDDLKDEVMEDLVTLAASIDRSGVGVCVQASTLGSLEALITYLKQMKIPVSGFNLGTVHKKDVSRASVMLERSREYAQILAFDVKVDREAELEAESLGVKIFKADVIYHLFDAFKKHMDDILEQKRKDQAPQAIFPCVLRIVPGSVFNKRNPIIIGVDVVEGQLRVGTPLAAVTGQPPTIVQIGKVTSIELNHKAKDVVKKNEPAVAIKIESPSYEAPKLIGRHFTEKDSIISAITRQSIDVLKDSFRNDVSKDEWATIVKLKKVLQIP
ncbi:hypothetical protein HDU93_009470 [Gonapodya sp. JEL0774]|nr:hypothetical protein HDU93_009470 [Gonapodya sp. JEL0774]